MRPAEPSSQRAAPDPFASFRRRLDGALLPAVPVPFDAAGNFVPAAHDAYVRHLAADAIDGVAVWAHTGRGLHLDAELAREVLSAWRAALGPEQILVAGAGARPPAPGESVSEMESIARAVAMAERAREGGADALLVYAPVAFRDHPEQRHWVAEYHRALGEVGLPLIAFYLYKAAGGISYSLMELRDILGQPSVAAIKMATLDSVCTYQDVSRLIEREFPSRVVLTGEDRFLGYSLLRGSRGALIGMAAVLPGFQKRLVVAARSGAAAEAVRLMGCADRLAETLFVPPLEAYIRRLLFVLSVLGVIDEDAAHDPWFPAALEADEKAAIARTVAELAEETAGG